jgi:hypothetical protein
MMPKPTDKHENDIEWGLAYGVVPVCSMTWWLLWSQYWSGVG